MSPCAMTGRTSNPRGFSEYAGKSPRGTRQVMMTIWPVLSVSRSSTEQSLPDLVYLLSGGSDGLDPNLGVVKILSLGSLDPLGLFPCCTPKPIKLPNPPPALVCLQLIGSSAPLSARRWNGGLGRNRSSKSSA